MSGPDEYPTAEELLARSLAELVGPLRDRGVELERMVTEANAELSLALEQLAELGVRVERLAVALDPDAGSHSARVEGETCGEVDADLHRRCVRVVGHVGEHWYEREPDRRAP